MTAAATTYTFHVVASSDAVAAWAQEATEADLTGTLADALRLSADLDSPISLWSLNGERRGRVEPDGSYRLTTMYATSMATER
jgi:hypothetical protein